MVTQKEGSASTKDEVARALGEMPYGMYIVGSRTGDDVNGMMADWVMQVSLQPRLVAVPLEKDTRTLANVRATEGFTVNLLADDSEALASRFAQPYYGSKIRGRGVPAAAEIHHKLEGIDYLLGEETGCPILDGTLAWFECRVEELVPIGDHVLVVGRVVNAAVEREADPLTSQITGWVYSG